MAKRQIKFSPSHSERWMNCPGALNLCATLPEPSSSKYAREGTAAHELAANCLRQKENADQWIGEVIEVEGEVYKVTAEMAENVQVYLDAVREDMEREGIDVSELSVEAKFSVPEIPELSGTNDASFSSYLGKLYVYDYKHGAGTYVEVVNNPQLMIYALGALEAYGGVNDTVEIVIAQPRFRGGEDVARVRRWELTKDALLVFRDDVILRMGYARNPKAELMPGSWCGKSFCPAFGVCSAVRDKAVATVDPKIKLSFPEPASLKPGDISRILELSGHISDWADAVHTYAERQAIDLGTKIPGYKLVAKKGRRAWVDSLTVENEFEHEFGEAIYDKSLKSPAQLEKIVGKDRVAPLTVVPDNGVQLVPESAKGEPVVAHAEQVFQKLS